MTSLITNSRKPDITFYPNGRIDIKARIAKLLSLGDGDVINVAKHNREYLLYVRQKKNEIVGQYEGTVHVSKKGKFSTHNMRTYSLQLTNAMYKEVGMEITTPLRLPAGDVTAVDGIGIAIPLITRCPL